MKIKRIDNYTNELFSQIVLNQRGAFLVDEKPYEVEIISNDSAIVRGKNSNFFEKIIEEFRYYSPHITNFFDEENKKICSFEKENILKAKLEIKEGLQGPLFVNGDDELLQKEKAYKSGFNKNNGLIAYNLKTSLTNSTFNVNINNKEYEININLPAHLINNVLIAIHIGLYLNVDIDTIIKALKDYQTFDMRMNILKDKHNNTIINDCYNSSLESLTGVLKLLKKENQNKLLILGDINELGTFSKEIHQTIPLLLNEINNKKVILIGQEITKIKYDATYFNNYKEVVGYLNNKKIKDTLILIKASRSLKLENITNFLTQQI